MVNENYIIVKANRTSCLTGESKVVEVKINRTYHKSLNSWWIQIVSGGITGYESIREDDVKKMTGGWSACVGTKGGWDSLFIPAEEVLRIADWVDKNKNSKDKIDTTKHAGDCTIYSCLENGNPEDDICTCGSRFSNVCPECGNTEITLIIDKSEAHKTYVPIYKCSCGSSWTDWVADKIATKLLEEERRFFDLSYVITEAVRKNENISSSKWEPEILELLAELQKVNPKKYNELAEKFGLCLSNKKD